MAEKEDVVGAVVSGFDMILRHNSERPWADAAFAIDYLEGFDDLNDSDLIVTLAGWAGRSYKEFKGLWDSLSDKEKSEALADIESETAVLGFEELLKVIAADFDVMEDKDMREKIINAAKRYVNGEIDLHDFAVGLEDILWPTEKDKKDYEQAVMDYWDGIGLTDYIEEDKVKAMVKEYLIKELEAVEAAKA